jgi:hypothetical protein
MSERPRLLDLFCGAGGAAMGEIAGPPDNLYPDIKGRVARRALEEK